MSFHDYSLANQTPASFRTDGNNLFNAIATNNYSTQSLATTFQAMSWADATSSGWMRLRDTSDSTWYYWGALNAHGGLLTYSGNPSTGMIGRYVGQPVWDTANKVPYWCTLAGTSSQATWSRAMLSSETPGSPAGYIGRVAPIYTNATTITFPGGFICRDAGNAADISISTAYTLDLTVSGAGGLSTALTEASSQWYYAYAIRKSTDGTVNFIYAATSSGGVFPSGYDQQRLVFVVRNSSAGDILPFVVGPGWPYRPEIIHDVTFNLIGTTSGGDETSVVTAVNSTSFSTAYDCSKYIPPIARQASFIVHNQAAGNRSLSIRANGSTYLGATVSAPQSGSCLTPIIKVSTDQQVQVKGSGSAFQDMSVYSYVIDQLTTQ